MTSTKSFTITPSISDGNIPGATVGTAVNLSGSGFAMSSAVTVKLGTKKISTVPATPMTSTSGGLSGVTFAVPSMAAGTYALTATDASGNQAKVQFIVS